MHFNCSNDTPNGHVFFFPTGNVKDFIKMLENGVFYYDRKNNDFFLFSFSKIPDIKRNVVMQQE